LLTKDFRTKLGTENTVKTS